MFDDLTGRLEKALKNVKGEGRLTELNVAKSIKEIRRALVAADVNFKIAKEFTEDVKKEALGAKNVLKAVKPGELMVKIVMDKMTELMGGQAVGIDLSGKPSIILISGLQGSGKTTFTGKLAKYLHEKKQKKVLVVAGDVYRPAAIEQLSVVAEQVSAEIYKEEDNKDPVAIAKHAIEYAKENKFNVVIVDTAGRLAVDEQMMNEIESIKKALNPNETLFVVDSMTGQDAINTAKTFNDRLDFDGVVLTKLDGDTRGGAALSVKYTVGKPIKFVSNGEKMQDLEMFHPDRMAQRILGMGDIVTFVEKAQEQFDEVEAKKLERKIKKNKFDYNDFLSQIKQIKRMGDLKGLMKMIPGMGKMMKDVDIDDSAFNKVEAIIHSMTPEERAKPELMNMSRKRRISKGSGQSIHEVNMFIKQFEQMKKMMYRMSKMKGLPDFGGLEGFGK
jgi:signal recognition particle subunit SRP54